MINIAALLSLLKLMGNLILNVLWFRDFYDALLVFLQHHKTEPRDICGTLYRLHADVILEGAWCHPQS